VSKQIFRKVSLDRLSSPEQLDLLMQVTNPRGWIALLALGALVLCALIWGIWGSIPTKVMGQGILIRTGGVFNMVSPSAGRIKDLYFESGSIIKKGQVIARIAQPEILERIKRTRASLEELEEQYAKIKDFGSKQIRLENQSMDQQQITLKTTIITLHGQIEWLNEKIKNQGQLVKQGVLTKQQLLNTRLELSNAEREIRNIRNQLKQLGIRQFKLKGQNEQELITLKQRINETKRELESLLDELNKSSKVTSPFTGRILEVGVDTGSMVNIGSSILKMELIGKNTKNLEAVLYFPAREGKKIQLGLQAQISPSTVKQEEYGFMQGMVTSVSEFPASRQTMLNTFHNESLVADLSMGGAPIEVHADLIPDPGTQSGYKWSSSSGPALTIETGTLCFSTVMVAEQRPISLIIPLFKKHVMGIGEE